jgi:hypothetical protein
MLGVAAAEEVVECVAEEQGSKYLEFVIYSRMGAGEGTFAFLQLSSQATFGDEVKKDDARWAAGEVL